MIRNAVDEVAIKQGCWFDEAAVEKVLRFFDLLRLTKGRFAGQPMQLIPWEIEYISQAFGWKRPDGTRRFREVYCEISKKNGKSGLAAGLALEGLCEEPGAQVFVGARTQKQALEVFDEAGRMVNASPGLARHMKWLDSTHVITFAAQNSALKTLTADTSGQDGKDSNRIIVDEVHRLPNRKLYDVTRYAGKAREQPLLLLFTTAGDSKDGICWELHERATRIIKGIDVDDIRFLPIVFAADEADDLDSEVVWRKANPALGVILNIDDFREEHRNAKKIPAAWLNFKQLSLGIWIENVGQWLDVRLWDQCEASFDVTFFKGRRTFATLDLSSRVDLTALTLTTVVDEEYGVRIPVQFTYYFCPAERIRWRSERDEAPYQQWVDEGWLIATPGGSVQQPAILRKLNELRDSGIEIETVGADAWNLGFLETGIPGDGFELVLIGQSIGALTACCKEFERLIVAQEIRHDGNPVTRWCVGNAAAITDSNENIKYSKHDQNKRIDGVATSCMGVGLAMRDEPPPTPRVTLYGP